MTNDEKFYTWEYPPKVVFWKHDKFRPGEIPAVIATEDLSIMYMLKVNGE